MKAFLRERSWPYIHRALKADDLAIWTVAETIGTAQTRIQDAISSGQRTGVSPSMSKTASISQCFSLHQPSQSSSDLKVNGHDIPASSTIKYIGVTFDQRLTWSKHILEISSRATLRMKILKKLAGTHWGANLKTLEQVYIGSARPVHVLPSPELLPLVYQLRYPYFRFKIPLRSNSMKSYLRYTVQ